MDPTSATLPPASAIRARFGVAAAGRTALAQLFETGSLRLRVPRGPHCQGLLVNTGGGILGGDRLATAVALEAGGRLTLATVAAEKVYRSAGPEASVETVLDVADAARLDWLPQETILFDGSRLRRTLHATLAGSARLLAAETLVFGRLAAAETIAAASLRDAWRVRRDGRLVFADETRLDGALGAILDRPAVAAGARAVALLLFCAPEAEDAVDAVRETLAPFLGGGGVEAGVSARDDVLVLRALARSPERLRACMVAALDRLRQAPGQAPGQGSGLARLWA